MTQPRSLRHRLAAPLAALACLATAGAAQAQFQPSETEVCPAAARVYDPEFNVALQQMAWYDGRGGLRVAPVLADGSIGSAACEGTLLQRNVTLSLPGLPYRAGPEWAQSVRGHELYYTRLDRDGRPYLARSRWDGSWRHTTLSGSTDRGLALVSNDAADAEPRLVYLQLLAAGEAALRWREAGRPETEAPVPGTVDPATGGSPRWVPGLRALSFALPDAAGTRQAVLYDVDAAQTRFLTDDAGAKDEVWLWPAPEFGGELALMTVVDGCCLRLYRQDGDRWLPYREIAASSFSGRPRIFSPEILVHGGRSYAAMVLASQRTGPGEVWMVDLAPAGGAPVLLSDPARRGLSRSEPEWMVTPSGVFVYVTASDPTNRFALNRLRTPLNPP